MPVVQADRLTHIGTALLIAAGASEEEFFEHPAATGRTNSRAARVANAIGRRPGVVRGSKLGVMMLS